MGSKELPWFAVNLPFAAIVLWIFSGGLWFLGNHLSTWFSLGLFDLVLIWIDLDGFCFRMSLWTSKPWTNDRYVGLGGLNVEKHWTFGNTEPHLFFLMGCSFGLLYIYIYNYIYICIFIYMYNFLYGIIIWSWSKHGMCLRLFLGLLGGIDQMNDRCFLTLTHVISDIYGLLFKLHPSNWNNAQLYQGSDKGGGVVQRILIGTRHKA